MKSLKNDFQVLVNNQHIANYQVKKPIARIGFDLDYELQMARLEMGITLQEFEAMPGTQIWCVNGELSKSDLLVLYRLSKRTEAVGNDIQQKYLARKK